MPLSLLPLAVLAALTSTPRVDPMGRPHGDERPAGASSDPLAASFFEGTTRVSLTELVAALAVVADGLELDPRLRAEFDAFARERNLPASLFPDYVRVRMAFEATRDGGFWHMRWAITHRAPNSDAIWEQWRRAEPWTAGGRVNATATAECDEISALFAFIVRRLGVDRVGLFWPQWNHVVAVWTVADAAGRDLRIVVPTSQIFLAPEATLGTQEFDPWRQKTIYTYKRRDVSDRHAIPVALARFFVAQAVRFGASTLEEAQALRNARSGELGGS